MAAPRPVLVAFASTWEDRTPTFLEHLQAILPEAELVLVAESPPPRSCPAVQWIAWFPRRSLRQNLARIGDELRGCRVLWTALVLDRLLPYWAMRAAALWVSRGRLLVFNENLHHFALRPGDLRQALRFLR